MPDSLPPEDEIARLRVENELLHDVLDCIGAICRGGWPDSQKLQTIREAAEQYAPSIIPHPLHTHPNPKREDR